ncbi:MAG: hypothetical protein EOP53_10755 [Sphingobacteriales bacterium]|nr:MAG: hypothetical protein EOP53_10755 [Sphingobacteriales bacterium]
MKRFTGIVLIMLMGYNLIGYFPAFYALQTKIKREMRRAIRRNAKPEELTVFTFSLENNKITDTDFDLKDEHEFSYKGEMYDVVRTEKTGNTITFYCLNDKKEKQLFANLNQSVKQNSAENPFQKSSKLFNTFCKLEFISTEKLSPVLQDFTIQNIFSPYHIWRSGKHITQFSPPPEFLV